MEFLQLLCKFLCKLGIVAGYTRRGASPCCSWLYAGITQLCSAGAWLHVKPCIRYWNIWFTLHFKISTCESFVHLPGLALGWRTRMWSWASPTICTQRLCSSLRHYEEQRTNNVSSIVSLKCKTTLHLLCVSLYFRLGYIRCCRSKNECIYYHWNIGMKCILDRNYRMKCAGLFRPRTCNQIMNHKRNRYECFHCCHHTVSDRIFVRYLCPRQLEGA